MNTHDYLQALIDDGWSQTRISEETGVHQPAISRILANKQGDVRHSAAIKIEALYWSAVGRKAKAAPKAEEPTCQGTDRRVGAEPGHLMPKKRSTNGDSSAPKKAA